MQTSTSFKSVRSPHTSNVWRHYPRLAPRHRTLPRRTALGLELADAAGALESTLANLVALAPAQIQPAISLVTQDVAAIANLQPSAGTLGRLLPNPVNGIIDFFLLGPLSGSQKKAWGSKDFQLRDKLGGGNFGVTYEGLKLVDGERTVSRKLTPEQKKRRVVLKKVNIDREGVREDFLKAGTMARGSAESGKVEAYMCARVRRNLLVRGKVAEYLGTFQAGENEQGFAKGQQWLVWKFESDSTLGDACDGQLGPFPECLEEIMLGRPRPELDSLKRDTLIVKAVLKQVLQGVDKLHAMGIVHRDVKPDNLLVTVDGEVKIIDFGAAADMCMGVNFNPEFGMLDPRYSPPEELIMPKGFPKSPGPLLTALLSPFAWLYGRPDLFDSYSVGVLLLQMSIPQLRRSPDIRSFNQDLRLCDFDLERWRRTFSSRYCFALLDRNNKAGWDLATKLVCRRDKFNRGRLSCSQALGHRFFRPEF